MPQPVNRVARITVPIVLALLGIGVGFAFFLNSKSQAAKQLAASQQPIAAQSQAQTQPPAPATTAPAPAAADQSAAPVQPSNGAQVPVENQSAKPTPALAGAFKAKVLAAASTPPVPLGDVTKGSKASVHLEFTSLGAGIASLQLTDHFTTVEDNERVALQSTHDITVTDGSRRVLIPFAALFVRINGLVVDLSGKPAAPVWNETAPGAFEAIVLDAGDTPVLRIAREFKIADGSHDIVVNQRIENLSATPLQIEWSQVGPTELPPDGQSSSMDVRFARFGYLLSPGKDPTRAEVATSDHAVAASAVVGKTTAGTKPEDRNLWPNPKSTKEGHSLVWAANTNRYFAVAAHPTTAPMPGANKSFQWLASIDPIAIAAPDPKNSVYAMAFRSVPFTLPPAGAPGATGSLDFAIFAGPLDRKEIEKEPSAKFLGLPSLVVYNMGGLCGWCTFDWLSTLLRMVLHGLHTLTRDWSLAIMLLVLCVRTVLHPLTRWSQVKMGLMGRRMQAVAPKQKAIQEKFKDDPRKIQEETAKLWREEGVNPLGCIGILPSFLQTPVWIAMYAALFFSFELRHQPGFYGIFQSIFGQPSATSKFWFLSDLAQPDRLFYFGRNLTQDISWLPNFDAINILPLLMGAVFFAQQKYLTPPTTATLTPEQEAQQKMIKWMSVLMFPLMMYNAPSGLALYFTTNSTLAIFESRWIRGHLDAYEKKNPPKKGGAPNSFMAKLMAAAAEKQKQSQSFQGGADRPPRKRV